MTNLILAIDAGSGPDASLLDREWLDTNGRGGYASSTLIHCHTRKYHGLLVANLASPPGRYVLLSKFEDSLLLRGREHFLSGHQYPGVFFPEEVLLRGFGLEDGPVFLYEARCAPEEAPSGPQARERRGKAGATTVRLRQSVRMVAGEDAVLIRYDLESCPAPAVLRLRPFLAYRGQHELSRRNPFVRNGTEPVPNGFRIAPYQGMPPLYLQTNRKNRFTAQPLWYENFEYAREGERGYDRHEDLFTPGFLDVPFRSGEAVFVRAATSVGGEALHRLWRKEEARRRSERRRFIPPDRTAAPFDPSALTDQDRSDRETLLQAARHFLITTPSGRPALIAGYPWFGDGAGTRSLRCPGSRSVAAGWSKAPPSSPPLQTMSGTGSCPTFSPKTAAPPRTIRSTHPSGSSGRFSNTCITEEIPSASASGSGPS